MSAFGLLVLKNFGCREAAKGGKVMSRAVSREPPEKDRCKSSLILLERRYDYEGRGQKSGEYSE